VDVLLSENDIVQPDLLFISNDRAEILTALNVQGAPDLVIEILSDSTRRLDETAKLKLYERAGVREYWLVDARDRAVRVFRRAGTGFLPAQGFSSGDTLTTPLLPGLEIRVSEIFA
jgi:Uma2 family endonuclease